MLHRIRSLTLTVALAFSFSLTTLALEPASSAAGPVASAQGKKKPRHPRPAKPDKKLKPEKKPAKKNDLGFPL